LSRLSAGADFRRLQPQRDFQSPKDSTGFQPVVINLSYDANNNRLFVADTYAQRVTAFNAGPSVISNGMNYSAVLTGFDYPVSVFFDPGSGRLFVGDLDNYRILIFDGGGLPGGDYFNP
jgi:hypothetical protein